MIQLFAEGRGLPLAESPVPQADTTPKPKTLFQRIGEYRDSLRSKQYRDSLIRRVTRQNVPEPDNYDSAIIKSEQYFTPFAGKVIRDIYYRQVKVFGPSSIRDTAFTTTMKLIHLANRLHFSSQEWAIRQCLFFRENDTINPFVMADNERYLRNRPFIQDARLYIINTGASPDSIDLLVVTKDVFEYGADISSLSTNAVDVAVFNNNLFGAGQGVRVGAAWHNRYNRPWGSEARYTKYNVAGTFIDVSAGYTTLNNYMPLDTGVYEGSYYVSLNRPLYRSTASWVGGVTLANSFSINARDRPDTMFRDYRYQVIDVWGGYNFLKQDKRNLYSRRPSIALLLRHYNLFFSRRPDQPAVKEDPVYNNRRYYLANAVVYRQDFFKAQHFFGFGRTEDIPLGYTISLAAGWESWTGRRRGYTGLEAQKFWPTKRQGLFNTTIGISSFWQNRSSEDAVLHARVEYYSRLLHLRWGRFRQFASIDYLGNPNNFFYRPLDVNMENGIWGYKRTFINGYQRLNLRSETVYYSPLKVFGFKFNFFTSLQASQITVNNNSLFKNPLYTGVGIGCRIRNENMSLNTLKLSANYYPNAPAPVKPLFFELTTVVDFRFDIYALKAPGFLQFR